MFGIPRSVLADAPLLERWFERLPDDEPVDLAEHGQEVVPELLRVYRPDGLTLEIAPNSFAHRRGDRLTVTLDGRLLPEDGGGDEGVIARTIDTRNGAARHDQFELPERFQGAGRGRAVLRDSVFLYREMGLHMVSLDAVNIGRYVWAMCGFDFTVDRERDEVLGAVAELADALGLDLDGLGDVRHPWEVALMESERPVTLRQLAEARGEELDPDPASDDWNEEILLGKALLLYSEYDGYEAHLDLPPHAEGTGYDQFLLYTAS